MKRPEIHDIVQVIPTHPLFGGCMVVVVELKDWGVMGYTQNAGSTGQAYIRLRNEEMALTGGKAVWIAE